MVVLLQLRRRARQKEGRQGQATGVGVSAEATSREGPGAGLVKRWHPGGAEQIGHEGIDREHVCGSFPRRTTRRRSCFVPYEIETIPSNELATGEEVTERSWLAAPGGNGLARGIFKDATVAPHTGLITEAVAVRAFVVATVAVALRLEEGIDERTHRDPSAPILAM